MKKVLILALLLAPLAALASPVAVIPQCSSIGGTYASLEALTNGCEIGDKIFSNFTLAGTQAATNITYAIENLPGEIGFDFDPLLVSTNSTPADALIGFDVTVANPGQYLITDAGLLQTGSTSGTGLATIGETICSPGPGTNCSTQTITLNTPNTTSGYSDQTMLTATGTVAVTKDILALGGSNGSASITGAEDTFSQTAVVPEPASILMFGSGLLGLAGAARRRFLK